MLHSTREIHPLEPQRHRHSMLAPRVCAPRVTRCSLCHVIWSVQLACSILSRSDSCQGDGRQRHLMMHGQCPIPVYSSQIRPNLSIKQIICINSNVFSTFQPDVSTFQHFSGRIRREAFQLHIAFDKPKGEVPHRARANATLCKWYGNEVFESNSTFRKSRNRLLYLSSANQIRPCFWREKWKVEFKNQKSHSQVGAFQTVGKAPTSLSWRIRAESTFPIC